MPINTGRNAVFCDEGELRGGDRGIPDGRRGVFLVAGESLTVAGEFAANGGQFVFVGGRFTFVSGRLPWKLVRRAIP